MRSAATLAIAMVSMAIASPSIAGPDSDALAKCLVGKATGDDNQVLVRWTFNAIASNPEVAGMTTITPAQRSETDSKMAATVERLLPKDCRAEATAALKADGVGVIGKSFEALGERASRTLMASPASQAAIGSFAQQLHQDQWAALMKEAGLSK